MHEIASDMELQHRALVAAQPGAWNALQRMLTDVVDLVPVHSIEDGFQVLDHDRVDVIIATIAFDDSRMVEFLQQCGAVDLLDLSKLPPDAARGALRAAIRACVQ